MRLGMSFADMHFMTIATNLQDGRRSGGREAPNLFWIPSLDMLRSGTVTSLAALLGCFGPLQCLRVG